MSPRQKEQEKKKTAFIFALFPFDRLTDRPMVQLITGRHSDPKKYLEHSVSESRVLPQKDFWTKKSEKNEKLRCHKKQEKNHQIVVSHHILTYPQLYTHMYTFTKNFILNYHQCHQSINQQNPKTLDFLLSSSPF
jgi:hypothetical protein